MTVWGTRLFVARHRVTAVPQPHKADQHLWAQRAVQVGQAACLRLRNPVMSQCNRDDPGYLPSKAGLASEMEFVTGYRAEILDFAELLFGWYRRFLLDCTCHEGSERRKRQEASIRRLPLDPALWVLHVLANRALAFTVADPGQQVGGRFYSEEALALRDLDRFITFVNAGEEEEETAASETAQHLWHVDHLLLLTDEHGTILGFDFSLGGPSGAAGPEPLAARAVALLCHSMTCPLGAGEARRPKMLTVGDPTWHK